MSATARLRTHADTATALALLGDRELTDLLASGTPAGAGIGGRATLLEVDGVRVFVKRVPLTDVELSPENVRSTANLFAMPAHCHYGIGAIGSPGFGAWRELAVHEMTTGWVRSGRFEGFPLLHHWRVLPDPDQPLPGELADVERAVAYWGGGREHIEALRTASVSLTLFLEYLPHTLHDWFAGRLRTDDADRACALVEQGLEAVTGFLHGQRLTHFDAHFGNILTDGRQLYLADYGLALTPRFRLAPDERDFYDRHRHYDRAYTLSYLVHWLVVDQYGLARDAREEFVRECADGKRPEGIPEAAAALISRHAQVASVVGDFNRRLEQKSRHTPYPTPEALGYSSSTLSA
ncbi:protein kinase family protein [Streptomyces sp. SID13726]|uniref:protein kinase family protein n=1 Tax=Streptomyces sp. SID13726 TaxID=2706058 RepID=UPI0013B77CF5|nr:protein kinase family protein [Streptomyces sp. SID13726]NEA99005.1 protein kinase family protein [Streptomyces sp. SID13726]